MFHGERHEGVFLKAATRLLSDPGIGTASSRLNPGGTSGSVVQLSSNPPGFRNGVRPSQRERSPTALVVAASKVCPPTSSIRASATYAFGRGRCLTTCLRNAAFLPRGSTSVIETSGRKMEIGTPGRPAPDPISATLAP